MVGGRGGRLQERCWARALISAQRCRRRPTTLNAPLMDLRGRDPTTTHTQRLERPARTCGAVTTHSRSAGGPPAALLEPVTDVFKSPSRRIPGRAEQLAARGQRAGQRPEDWRRTRHLAWSGHPGPSPPANFVTFEPLGEISSNLTLDQRFQQTPHAFELKFGLRTLVYCIEEKKRGVGGGETSGVFGGRLPRDVAVASAPRTSSSTTHPPTPKPPHRAWGRGQRRTSTCVRAARGVGLQLSAHGPHLPGRGAGRRT